MQTTYPLLDILSDGRFHSGEELGEALGITRAAIWKQLNTLRTHGLLISAVPGKGYRMTQPRELLSAEAIAESLLPHNQQQLVSIDVHHHIDSTNDYLAGQPLASSGLGRLCLAEQQSAGRGRRGREWVSPFGANLYLSLSWRFAGGLETLGGLSMVAGVSLVRTLRAEGVAQAALKWPNDVHCADGKLAGILVELAPDQCGSSRAVIGIGINVAMPPEQAERIDQPWTDLTRQLQGREISRNRLAGALTNELLEVIRQFESEGLVSFMNEWREYDLTYSKPVELVLPEERLSGVARGIDESGALLVDIDQRTRRFTSAEISLRMTE